MSLTIIYEIFADVMPSPDSLSDPIFYITIFFHLFVLNNTQLLLLRTQDEQHYLGIGLLCEHVCYQRVGLTSPKIVIQKLLDDVTEIVDQTFSLL